MTARPSFSPRRYALWRVLAAAVGLVAVAAQAQAPAPVALRPADFIVAVVNSEPITNNEVRARAARVQQQMTAERVTPPPRPELLRQVLERLINERVQLQMARQTGLKVDDSAIDEAERSVARQNGVDVAELRRRLLADGVSQVVFREDLHNQLLLSRVREREMDARIRVTEAEIDQFLREQQSASPEEVEWNLAQILVTVPDNVSTSELQALIAKARGLRDRARAGEDFAALARQASDATGNGPGGAGNGGAFGLRAGDRYPSLFLEAVASLPVGGVTDVLRSGAGLHVVKVLEKQVTGGLSVVQSRTRHILLRPGPQLTEAAARQRLLDYRQRILAGQSDFAALARDHSQDGSASNGGDLGWASPGMFVPEFEDVMNSLAPGQIAEPFASRFGVHLVQLLERRRGVPTVREQRDIGRNQVRMKKAEDSFNQWAQEARGRAFVDLREPPL
jgi:peptidyl-prolyl cis-trans isomerase SurA